MEVDDPPDVDDKSVTHTCGTDPATPEAGDEFTMVSEVTAGEDLDDVFVRFDFSDPVRGLYDRAKDAGEFEHGHQRGRHGQIDRSGDSLT